MGVKRKQPQRLAQKLLSIRKYLKLTQEEMQRYVQPEASHTPDSRSIISQFEKGKRAPNMLEIYNYLLAVRRLSKHKKFSFDCLADDELNLPWDRDEESGDK